MSAMMAREEAEYIRPTYPIPPLQALALLRVLKATAGFPKIFISLDLVRNSAEESHTQIVLAPSNAPE